MFRALVVAGIILGLWVARNYVEAGKLALSTNSGINLWIGNNAQANGLYIEPDWERYSDDEFVRDDEMAADATAHILANPLRTVQLWRTKLGNLYSPDFIYSDTLPLALWTLGIHFVLLGSALYLSLHVKEGRKVSALPALMLVAGTIMPLIFFAPPRLNFPIMPFVAIYAAAALVGRKTFIEKRGETRSSPA